MFSVRPACLNWSEPVFIAHWSCTCAAYALDTIRRRCTATIYVSPSEPSRLYRASLDPWETFLVDSIFRRCTATTYFSHCPLSRYCAPWLASATWPLVGITKMYGIFIGTVQHVMITVGLHSRMNCAAWPLVWLDKMYWMWRLRVSSSPEQCFLRTKRRRFHPLEGPFVHRLDRWVVFQLNLTRLAQLKSRPWSVYIAIYDGGFPVACYGVFGQIPSGSVYFAVAVATCWHWLPFFGVRWIFTSALRNSQIVWNFNNWKWLWLMKHESSGAVLDKLFH